MSGVAGLWHLGGGPLVPVALSGMLQKMSHRGPDGSGRWLGAGVGLGHLKLATTTEAVHEQLPASWSDLVVTADARIDNREELAQELRFAGREGPPADSALILRAYERWGERCAEKLIGDFAFAIWDARRGVLFCARDPVGVKPFYYHHRPGHLFAFASEIKGLLALEAVIRRLNEVKVADFLAGLFEDVESTFYEGILRLPPAHTLTVDRDGSKLRRYWELDPNAVIRCSSDAEYAEAFAVVFKEAVQSRLRSAGPIGSMLSGGLDSSSISCMAARLLAAERRGPLNTYSTIFDRSGASDERDFMNTVLACGGMEPNWLQGDDVTPLGGLDALPQPLDEPPYAWNLAPSLAVQQRASQHGRVLLDGLFGDNALCSYPDFHLAELLREGRLVSSMRLVRQYSSHHPGRGWNELKAYGLRPLMPKGVMAAWRRLRGSAGAAEARSEALVRLDFAKRIGIEARRSQLLARFQVPFTSARQLHLFELTAGIATAGFELSDAAAASVGVEPRYPFTDRRLVELSFGVPSEQKFVDGWPRSLLRRGMAGVLPDPIRWRRGKRGTGAWLAANLVADRARIESTLERNVDRIAAYVDPAAVKALLQGYLRDPTAASAAQLWAPLVLAEWLERTAA